MKDINMKNDAYWEQRKQLEQIVKRAAIGAFFYTKENAANDPYASYEAWAHEMESYARSFVDGYFSNREG